ncbi:hemagglutinin/hemolysin-like protein [Neisseria gonorrhoeae]|uniref:Hemagglutinin/hemolysin-like protein n=1 Tax=Neisseria gonorrhoeae TaxID=485 RepID=A0A378VXQ6_NEIGO|nr:hemagglutinin/hemolysin-like protein [Neisseria gonorrhoeae]
MNKTLYRVIFNRKRGAVVAVAETTKREGKSCADSGSGSVYVKSVSFIPTHSKAFCFSALGFLYVWLWVRSILLLLTALLLIKLLLKPNKPRFCKQVTAYRKSIFKPLLRQGFLLINMPSLMWVIAGRF